MEKGLKKNINGVSKIKCSLSYNLNLFASNTCRLIKTNTYTNYCFSDEGLKNKSNHERTPENGDDERATSAEIGNTIRFVPMYYNKIILIAIRKMQSTVLSQRVVTNVEIICDNGDKRTDGHCSRSDQRKWKLQQFKYLLIIQATVNPAKQGYIC